MPGVEDAALFRSTNGGQTWQELDRAAQPQRKATSGNRVPAESVCIRMLWTRKIRERIIIAISAAGAFRRDDAGKTWKPINRGLQVSVIAA